MQERFVNVDGAARNGEGVRRVAFDDEEAQRIRIPFFHGLRDHRSDFVEVFVIGRVEENLAALAKIGKLLAPDFGFIGRNGRTERT